MACCSPTLNAGSGGGSSRGGLIVRTNCTFAVPDAGVNARGRTGLGPGWDRARTGLQSVREERPQDRRPAGHGERRDLRHSRHAEACVIVDRVENEGSD